MKKVNWKDETKNIAKKPIPINKEEVDKFKIYKIETPWSTWTTHLGPLDLHRNF